MITVLVIVLLFSGGFGGKSLNLSDPAVLAEFTENVSQIIDDPVRAGNVTNAVFRLNVIALEARSQTGSLEAEIRDFRAVVRNYTSTREEVYVALGELGTALEAINGRTVEGREVIRQNTTKKEWNKLLTEMSK